MESSANISSYPRGLWAVFSAQAAIIAGTAIFNGLLIFYAIQELKLSSSDSYLLFAAYGTLEYTIPLLGGYIGARLIGYKQATIGGAVICAIGLAIMGVPIASYLTTGLGIFAFGSGLLVPNIFSLFGELYEQGDQRRDSGFTIVYAGMNLGALIGYLLSGITKTALNFHGAFYIASLITLSSAFIIGVYFRNFANNVISSASKTILSIFYSLIAITISIWSTGYTHELNNIVFIIGMIILLGLVIFAFTKKNSLERNTILAFCYLGVISIIFWALYMLTPTLLNYFNANYVKSTLFGLQLPSTYLLSLNPILLLIISPLAAKLWLFLREKHSLVLREHKFIFSILCMSLAFLFLAIGCWVSKESVNLFWILVFFLFQSTAEILIAPTGYSFVGVLFEKYNYTGIMLGFWQLFSAISIAISGFLASRIVPEQHIINFKQAIYPYQKAFFYLALVAFIIFIVYFMINRLKKLRSIHNLLNERIENHDE